MGFLVINGVTIDVEYGSWKEEPVDVGELSARSLAARPARARGTKVRRWTFRTTPTEMTAAEMEKLALWIEGEGQSWKFDNTLFSGNGVQKTASGTVTAAATGGKFSGKATVASGSVFGVKMSNKLGKVGGWLATVHGWSLLCRRKFVAGESASAGWRDLLMHGAVNFTRGVAANPTGVTQYVDGVVDAGADLGNAFSVGLSDPYVGPHGYLTDDSAADVDVDDFSFYPFEIPTDWIADIAAWRALYSWSALPRVKAWGDVFEDGLDVAPVEVIGTVTSKDVVQIADGGAVKNTLRSLTVMLEEWVTHTTAIEEPLAEPTPGALYTFDADADATLTLTVGADTQIDQADDADVDAALLPTNRYLIEDAGLIAADGPYLIDASTPTGRPAADFNAGLASHVSGASGYLATRWNDGAADTRLTTGFWFVGSNVSAIPELTRFIALKVHGASASGTPFSNSDCDWVFSSGLGTDPHFCLSLRDGGGGVIKLGLVIRDSAPSTQSPAEIDISALIDTWIIVVCRVRAGFVDLSVDGGVTWESAPITGDMIGSGAHYIGANYTSVRSFDGMIAYLRDYGTALSNDEVIATSEYIDGLVNG